MTFSKSKIYNLKDLIDILKFENDSYSEILNKIQFGFNEVEHLCFWDGDNYSKIIIAKEDNFEILLICWEKGQHSPIHNHDIREAWTYVLKGELTEEVYNKTNSAPALEKTTILPQKDVSSIRKDSNKIHRLTNSYDGRSVSLHLYKS